MRDLFQKSKKEKRRSRPLITIILIIAGMKSVVGPIKCHGQDGRPGLHQNLRSWLGHKVLRSQVVC